MRDACAAQQKRDQRIQIAHAFGLQDNASPEEIIGAINNEKNPNKASKQAQALGFETVEAMRAAFANQAPDKPE